MCPEQERVKRINENDVHKLEIPPPPFTLPAPATKTITLSYEDTMIKKFQRSSADHELQIPHLLRTPKYVIAANII